MMSPSNLAKERAGARAGASFLLKADVSQFYPALYTHAVGWAIDPKLRLKANWHNNKFLGAKIDQSLMDASAKISQGVPVGNDISFLLTEGVLARVDRAVRCAKERAYRWFDDYEIAFDTKEQAESGLARLHKELGRFKLRLNPAKTRIVELPGASQESWQQQLQETARAKFLNLTKWLDILTSRFDFARNIRNRQSYLYDMGVLFKITRPEPEVGRIRVPQGRCRASKTIAFFFKPFTFSQRDYCLQGSVPATFAQSSITQALLSEPGAAQKAFALLSFWQINGFSPEGFLVRDRTPEPMRRRSWLRAIDDEGPFCKLCRE